MLKGLKTVYFVKCGYKRAGASVITYVRVIDTTVYLLSVYDKGEKETVTDQEIKQMLNELS